MDRILEKFDFFISGLESVINDYGREIITKPLEIEAFYEGKKIQVGSPDEIKRILPSKSQQREGLRDVACEFATSDGKIEGKIQYLYNESGAGAYGWSQSHAVRATTKVNDFTERNREEYERIHSLLHKEPW